MAKGNTIGTGAVVLTANADRLLTGLDKAQKSTEKWASRASKGIGKAGAAGSKGGLIGGLLFGGVGLGAGGPAGLALAAVGAGLKLVDRFIDRLSQVGERAKQYANIDPATQSGIDRVGAAFERIDAAADGFFFKVAEKVAPVLERVADIAEKVAFIGGEAFGALVDSLGEAGDVGLDTFDVLRAIGKTLAWVWDVSKAGAGGVAYAAGAILEGYGSAVKAIADTTGVLDEWYKSLPGAIKGFIGGTAGADGLGAWASKAQQIGDGLQNWGKNAIAGLGQSAPAVDAWFDRTEKGFHRLERRAKEVGLKLSGAFKQGSTDAYSVMAKFNASNLLAGKVDAAKDPAMIAKQQLQEARELKRVVLQLSDQIKQSMARSVWDT